MENMFEKSVFNNDLSQWNVSNVKNMNRMFENSLFNQDISTWDIVNIEHMENMFYNSMYSWEKPCPLFCRIYRNNRFCTNVV